MEGLMLRPKFLFTATLLVAAVAGPADAQLGPDCAGYLIPVETMPGRCVLPFAKSLGPVRHLAWHPSGALVAAVRQAPGMILLRDNDGDGIADHRMALGPGEGGSGIAWRDGWLYFASDRSIWRYRWPADAQAPDLAGVAIITGMPFRDYGYAHNAKGIALSPDGQLYVSVGSATDNCANDTRAAPGAFPCPELATRAGIWAYGPTGDGAGTGPGRRVATGLRNAMALTVDSASRKLLVVSHGRDALNRRWGWDNTRSAEQPAELLGEVVPGADFGWPYCMPQYAPGQPASFLRAPEYEGLAEAEADCAGKTPFLHGFPGHWAPMSIVLDPTGGDSVVVAFHGSRGRQPLPEAGHQAVIGSRNALRDAVPLLRARRGSAPTRLVGSAWTPSGAIYLSDDATGRIWLVRRGEPVRR
jgi:glucose/arabinose dehydrogenase